jgi:hypothetical protein
MPGRPRVTTVQPTRASSRAIRAAACTPYGVAFDEPAIPTARPLSSPSRPAPVTHSPTESSSAAGHSGSPGTISRISSARATVTDDAACSCQLRPYPGATRSAAFTGPCAATSSATSRSPGVRAVSR